MFFISATGPKYLTTEPHGIGTRFIWTKDKAKAMPFHSHDEAAKTLRELTDDRPDLMGEVSGHKVVAA
jgi:hypothetical protein